LEKNYKYYLDGSTPEGLHPEDLFPKDPLPTKPTPVLSKPFFIFYFFACLNGGSGGLNEIKMDLERD